MQISKKTLSPKLAKQLHLTLCQLFVDVSTPEEADLIIKTLLSETERVAVMKRVGIAMLLQEHKPYEYIKDQVKVSSATIATVQSQMSQRGMKTVLEKIHVTLLADQWTSRISSLFSVFGKKS